MVKMEEDTDYSDTQSPVPSSMPEETMSTQENTVDSTVHTEQQGEEENWEQLKNKLHNNNFIWHQVQTAHKKHFFSCGHFTN